MSQSPAGSQTHPALQLLAASPQFFARCGHVAESWRQRNGRRFGPYYRLAYRDGNRQKSVYLGRAGELVEQVRQRLAVIQGPRRQCFALRQLQRHIRAILRVDKRNIEKLLRRYGLRLKGMELRGLRISPFRRLFPRRRFYMRRLSATVKPKLHPNRDPPPVRMAKYLEARDRLRSCGGSTTATPTIRRN
jgi:hypothetical protein